MSDPIGIADIMAGRVGALRSATESLILELGTMGNRSSDDGGEASATSIAASLKIKVDRVQNNLNILRKLSTEFEEKTKNIEKVSQAQRNLMFEYYWKLQVREMAGKGANVWLSQMTQWFPRMEYIATHASSLAGGVHHVVPDKMKAPMKVNERFMPKSSKRARSLVFDEQGDVQPADLGQMMEYVMKRSKATKFWKQTETTRGGRKVITAISCQLNNEIVVHMTFCPHIPEDGPNGEAGVSASPMTPSTPNSPAFGMNRGLRAKRQASLKAKKIIKKTKRDDLLAKVKMAAEEATKIEQEELRKLILDAKESGKDQEIARAAGTQVTKYIQRISVFPLNENAPLGAWSESKHKLFEQITLHARQALTYLRVHYPDTCFYHFFTWMSYYDKVYQTPCSACKKILAKTADDSTYVPPAFRDYSTGLPFHSNCM
ncbi:Aste57867_18084 [Aphanomyces stellatus]|uniref:Aste57867_18084 protein n=1 Tax=Aphanomyces stellatus TaxID=120398 RepID=A0A485L9T7_9STRA|nr:hypothetical protein As57867_018022 [Aphanomyces stellatus]VFT94823.1 Aste57867_18084 [Aphanomyces stellatus]